MLCFRNLYAIVLTSDVYDACVCVYVVVHWHCSAQLSMFNMEKHYRNKIIIIIIIIMPKMPAINQRRGITSVCFSLHVRSRALPRLLSSLKSRSVVSACRVQVSKFDVFVRCLRTHTPAHVRDYQTQPKKILHFYTLQYEEVGRERERDRQTDRQRERQAERERGQGDRKKTDPPPLPSPLPHSCTHANALSHTQARTHTHTHTYSLSLSREHSGLQNKLFLLHTKQVYFHTFRVYSQRQRESSQLQEKQTGAHVIF